MPLGTEFSMQGAMAAGNEANSYLKKKKDDADQQEIEKQIGITYDSATNMATFSAPPELFSRYKQDADNYQQILKIYQRSVAEKDARLEQMRQHPFMNTLATIAAHVAAQDPNPYTRGLGSAAVALNPPKDVLEAQKMGLVKEMGGMESEQLGRDIQMMEFSQRQGEMRAQHQERAVEARMRLKEIQQRYDQMHQDREARLAELRQHDKDLAKHYQNEDLNRKLQKGELDEAKKSRVVLQANSQIKAIDEEIARLNRQMEEASQKVEAGPQAGYKSAHEWLTARGIFSELRRKNEITIRDLRQSRDRAVKVLGKFDPDVKPGAETAAPAASAAPKKKGVFDPSTGGITYQ